MANHNVISFGQSAEQAQQRLRDRNVQRIISGMRERMGQTLPHLMQDMFEHLDDELYALSDRSVSDQMQTLYFEAMRELRKLRHSIERDFLHTTSGRFEQFWNNPGTAYTGPQVSDSSTDLDQDDLSLVAEEDLEEDLAISTMVSKAENRFHQALFALNKRLAVVVGLKEVVDADNPAGPKVLCEAFASALSQWEGDTAVRLVVFKLFDRYVMAFIGGLYDDLNDLLVENNVLPKISRKIRRNPVAPSVQRARDPQAGQTASQVVDNLPLDDEVLHQLASMIAERNSLGNDLSPARWYDLGASTPHLPQVSTQELLGALGTVQRTSLNQAPIDTESLREMQAELMASLGRELDVGALDRPVKRLGENDRSLLDVVGMLFDFILDDENLPEPMKALLGRLQIPLLKVGLQDRRFFSEKQHPARQLLNTLARAGLAWTDDGDRSQNSTYGQIESAVMRVLADFNDDLGIFEQVNNEFHTNLEREQRNATVAEQRLAQAREGQENLQQARTRVTAQIEQFVSECTPPECIVPEVIEQLLSTGWRDVMLLTLLREGEDSEGWRHASALVRELIWSVQPKQELVERQRLLKAIPELLKNLREGLNNISFDQHRSAVLLKELQACHIAALRGAPAGNPANEGAVSGKPGPAQAEAAPASAAEDKTQHPQDEYHRMAQDMAVGTWLDWTDDEGVQVRGKLSWRSDLSGNSVFVDRRGMKLAEMSLTDLANRLRCASARALEDMETPLMDRALGAMMDALKRTAPESRPD